MRFLHTADWHIGKQLRGRSRIAEQEQVVAEILDITTRSKVDCVLFGGDLFDSHAPPPDAERLVYNFFAELIGRKIPAVVIAGNHDHPRRLAALRQMLDPAGIYIRSEPARPSEGGVIDIKGVRIAMLPWISEGRVVEAEKLLGPEDTWYAEYAENVARMVEILTEGADILIGHLYVQCAQASGSERAIHISQPYEISPHRFSPSLNYVALGHLHRPQDIAAPCRACYAGSPLQLDFGEQGQSKRVVLVETRRGKPAIVESVGLRSGRALREINCTMPEIETIAVGDDYLKVVVRTEGPEPGIADRVRKLLPNALSVTLEYERRDAPNEQATSTELSPEMWFDRYYRAENDGHLPAEALLKAFREVYDEVTRETR